MLEPILSLIEAAINEAQSQLASDLTFQRLSEINLTELFFLQYAFFVLLLVEFFHLLVKKEFLLAKYKIPIQTFFANMVFAIALPIAITFFIYEFLQPYALLKTEFTWYWFIYALLVWELSNFTYHWLAHKVRILWCLHSPHHAPQHMNLSVTFSHFFLEGPYADLVRTSICVLLGLDIYLFILVRIIDGFWGAFIHMGEGMMPKGRMGWLEKIMITPAHHRAHHSRNPIYIDTNFCNILNIWDRVFGTYQELQEDTPPLYGINRKMNANSFVDVYFGEIVGLIKDLKHTQGLKNKMLLTLMPPGWKPAESLAATKIDSAAETESLDKTAQGGTGA